MNSKRIKIRNHVLLIVGFLVFTLLFLSYFNYKNRLNNEIVELDATMSLIADSLNERLETIDKLYILLEKDVDLFIMEKLIEVNEAYLKHGDINFDLESYNKFNNGFEVHVINEDLEIINSTDEEKFETNIEIREDTSKILNSFSKDDEYVSQKIKLEDTDLKVTKQGYYQTTDGKYTSEGDYHMDKFGNLLGADSFSSFSGNALNMNKSIIAVTLLNASGETISDDNSRKYNDNIQKATIAEALSSGKKKTIMKYENSTETLTYIYSPYQVKKCRR